MCIRDREWRTDKYLRQLEALLAVLDGKSSLIISGSGEVIAVSYTHLRAHETVLDLVCRLLLEKKKHA